MVRFQYSLARELGMTHRQLLSDMSVPELVHWMAFFKLEQLDRERAQQDAEDKAAAQRALRGLRGY